MGRPGALGELEARHALPAYADPLSARNNAVRGTWATMRYCSPADQECGDIEDSLCSGHTQTSDQSTSMVNARWISSVRKPVAVGRRTPGSTRTSNRSVAPPFA